MKHLFIALVAMLSVTTVSANAKSSNVDYLTPGWVCSLSETHMRGISGGFVLGGALYYSNDAELSCVSALGEVVDHIPVSVTIKEGGLRTGGSLVFDMVMVSANIGIESLDHIYNEVTLGASTGGTLFIAGARASAGFSFSNSSQFGGLAGKADFGLAAAIGWEWNKLSGAAMIIQSR